MACSSLYATREDPLCFPASLSMCVNGHYQDNTRPPYVAVNLLACLVISIGKMDFLCPPPFTAQNWLCESGLTVPSCISPRACNIFTNIVHGATKVASRSLHHFSKPPVQPRLPVRCFYGESAIPSAQSSGVCVRNRCPSWSHHDCPSWSLRHKFEKNNKPPKFGEEYKSLKFEAQHIYAGTRPELLGRYHSMMPWG